jgi:hypothetical protein
MCPSLHLQLISASIHATFQQISKIWNIFSLNLGNFFKSFLQDKKKRNFAKERSFCSDGFLICSLLDWACWVFDLIALFGRSVRFVIRCFNYPWCEVTMCLLPRLYINITFIWNVLVRICSTIFPVAATNTNGQTERWPATEMYNQCSTCSKIFMLGPLNFKTSTVLVTGMISYYIQERVSLFIMHILFRNARLISNCTDWLFICTNKSILNTCFGASAPSSGSVDIMFAEVIKY